MIEGPGVRDQCQARLVVINEGWPGPHRAAFCVVTLLLKQLLWQGRPPELWHPRTSGNP